jgi:K+-sensing histidine kinase KdpD
MNPRHSAAPVSWRLAAITGLCALVAMLGVADYLTGDYSLVILYLLPIAGASWYYGRRLGLPIAVACGMARFLSDYFLHGSQSSSLHNWNLLVEFLFFIIVALLVTALHRALSRRD